MCAYYVVLLLSYICIYSYLVSKDEKDTQELIGKANFEGYPAAAMKENIQKSLPTYTKKSCKNHQKYLQNPPQRHPKWLFGPPGALLGALTGPGSLI